MEIEQRPAEAQEPAPEGPSVPEEQQHEPQQQPAAAEVQPPAAAEVQPLVAVPHQDAPQEACVAPKVDPGELAAPAAAGASAPGPPGVEETQPAAAPPAPADAAPTLEAQAAEPQPQPATENRQAAQLAEAEGEAQQDEAEAEAEAEAQEDEEVAAALFDLAAAATTSPARAAAGAGSAFDAAAAGLPRVGPGAGPPAIHAQYQPPTLQWPAEQQGGVMSPRKRPRKPSKKLDMYAEFTGGRPQQLPPSAGCGSPLAPAAELQRRMSVHCCAWNPTVTVGAPAVGVTMSAYASLVWALQMMSRTMMTRLEVTAGRSSVVALPRGAGAAAVAAAAGAMGPRARAKAPASHPLQTPGT